MRWNVNDQKNQRRVLVEQSSNLVALPPNVGTPILLQPSGDIPSRSSGSFPAVPNARTPPPPAPAMPPPSVTQPSGGKSGHSWKLIIGFSILVILIVVASAMCILCRSKAAKTIGPWKTGLSGQLQKAFVTGSFSFSIRKYQVSVYVTRLTFSFIFSFSKILYFPYNS